MDMKEMTVFRELDLNKRHILDTKSLTIPPGLRISRKQFQEEKEKTIEPVLSFFQLQLELHSLLNIDPASPVSPTKEKDLVERAWDNARERKRQVSRYSPRHLREMVFDLFSRTENETRQFIESSVEILGAREGSTLTCTRVINVLRCKRLVLYQGVGAPLQDLADWLRFAVLLDEDVPTEEILHFVSQLQFSLQPVVKKVIRDMIGKYPRNTLYYLYLKLEELVSASDAVLRTVSSIHGRNYTMTLDYLIELDERVRPNNYFKTVQHEIKPGMRAVLCEWLFDFAVNHQPYGLKMETYFLGVSLLDRFLGVKDIQKKDFFLYGCAAFLLASKYVETYTIPMQCLTTGVQRAFTMEQLVEAEMCIVTTLRFRIATTTSSQLASAILVAQVPRASERQFFVQQYVLATLSLHTYLGQYRQTLLAALAVYISCLACGVATAPPSKDAKDLFPFARAILSNNSPHSKVGAILWKTFSQEDFGCVTELLTDTLLKHA